MIRSAILKYRSGPVFYEFHQDPDFFYLTGFLEPESVAVIGSFPAAEDGYGVLTPAKKRRVREANIHSTCSSVGGMRLPSYGMAPGRGLRGLLGCSMLIKCEP